MGTEVRRGDGGPKTKRASPLGNLESDCFGAGAQAAPLAVGDAVGSWRSLMRVADPARYRSQDVSDA